MSVDLPDNPEGGKLLAALRDLSADHDRAEPPDVTGTGKLGLMRGPLADMVFDRARNDEVRIRGREAAELPLSIPDLERLRDLMDAVADDTKAPRAGPAGGRPKAQSTSLSALRERAMANEESRLRRWLNAGDITKLAQRSELRGQSEQSARKQMLSLYREMRPGVLLDTRRRKT